jgi:hypothetical protein
MDGCFSDRVFCGELEFCHPLPISLFGIVRLALVSRNNSNCPSRMGQNQKALLVILLLTGCGIVFGRFCPVPFANLNLSSYECAYILLRLGMTLPEFCCSITITHVQVLLLGHVFTIVLLTQCALTAISSSPLTLYVLPQKSG